MKKAFAGKRKVLIIGIVFVIAIVGIMVTLMVKQPDEAGKRAENTENELPADIKSEIERLFLTPEMKIKTRITRWSADRTEKRIDIFVRKLTPENQQLHGKIINGWTMNITEDVELKKEEEELIAELERLKEKPEMEIGGWVYGIDDPRIGNKRVDIFVYNLTPENQQLHGRMIDGWKVYVWKARVPPEVNETGK